MTKSFYPWRFRSGATFACYMAWARTRGYGLWDLTPEGAKAYREGIV